MKVRTLAGGSVTPHRFAMLNYAGQARSLSREIPKGMKWDNHLSYMPSLVWGERSNHLKLLRPFCLNKKTTACLSILY